MLDQNPRKIHIYTPLNETSYDASNWAEQVLGIVVKPLYHEFKQSIDWIWIGRYGAVIDDVPERYHDANNNCRFLALRLLVRTADSRKLQNRTLRLIESAECYAPGWDNFNAASEFETRFTSAEATVEERDRRFQLVLNFLDATTRLILDTLTVDASGIWRQEPSIDEQNPYGSIFESAHHLFCNATGVPTYVYLQSTEDGKVQIGTPWMRFCDLPEIPPGRPHPFPINY